VLNLASSEVTVGSALESWLEPGQTSTVQEVAESPRRFSPHPVGQPFDFSPDTTVWIRMQMVAPKTDSSYWILNIPLVYLDTVEFYQRNAAGQWVRQMAGDSTAHALWSQNTYSPVFSFELAAGETQEFFLRVRNFRRANIPINIAAYETYMSHSTLESLGIGLMLGITIAMFGLSVLRYLEFRVQADAGAALYALVIAITIAQVNGMLNATLWQHLPLVANALNKTIDNIAIGSTLLYMRKLYALSIHYHRFDRLLGALGVASIGLALSHFLLPPATAVAIGSALYLMAAAAATTGAMLSWRAGSRVWGWLLGSSLPQSLCILWLAAEGLDLVGPLWQIRYIASLCIALSVPMLAIALHKLTQERKDRSQRIQQLDRQDALTGLLHRSIFVNHLVDAMTRVHAEREVVGLVVVDLVNYANIGTMYGAAMAEQCELRAVVKLHRVLRDVDPASRIAPGKYALLLEGVTGREQMSARMVQLIASGLTPQPGLEPPVVLQFHAAGLLLQERAFEADAALDALLEMLDTMPAGTRRPIRFIDVLETVPAELGEA
jgi:GGDEF domain-containing protein